MKKLLLASDGPFLISQGYQLLGIPFDEVRISYITTASKGAENTDYLQRYKDAMQRDGLRFDEMDIEGKSRNELLDALEGKNVIHVEGGNTFYLLKAVKKTGFDEILKEKILEGIHYFGTSAGAYIACPTIEMSTWGPATHDRYGLEDLTALGLVPFLLKAHYTDDMEELMRERITQSRFPVRILRDGQGIFVDGDQYRFVGEGKEVVFI